MKTLKISAVALVSTLSLAACDGDGGTIVGGLPRGQFEGEVSGVLDTSVRGQAESGYAFVQGAHDVIVLTDFTEDVQVVIYDSEDDFREGRWTIEDENDFDGRVLAYVEDLRTGETFGSVSGTLDLGDVRSGGIEGRATFRAESDDSFGDFITVDVDFSTTYRGDISLNRSPSLSRSPRRSN
ncbi:hypothetical protein [Longimicrobium sp.]|uniref:hypothetical protein n=1 Tax=Longimicrobium sp. TaxID=2029185 RepID=UPI002E33889C|nr:hypothetical protein [Longimicrobium sp.]HEX6039729.1 hypothetical protein [Longimicrobium sp.]